MAGQTAIFPVTRIYTDWNGYWTSNAPTGAGNRPDRENNLLAFTWNNVTYSTGVNNTILDAHAIGYSTQKFRALKIQTLGQNNSTYILQGSMIDESASTASIRPVLAGTLPTGAELASRLTDGINGLALGTGVANIKAGTAEFKIGTNNLNLLGIGDGFPDLIVTQVADPGGALDTFKFVDAAGNTVGTEVSINFNTVSAVGTYSLDLFKADGGANSFSPASTRDIRILGIELSEFNLTSANSSQVDRFVINFSGSSDCAFIAFNTKSLKIAELKLIKKATLSNCGKQGDVINYAFEITNTGEVPITDIHVTDPMPGLVISGNSIASLAPGATTTLSGTYTITSTDVDAGKVVNTAKVTGTDPSLNTVEDIAGATTILLTAPTIGTITDISCVNAFGSVVLNDLPATGTWTLQRSPDNVTETGTGATATISNIPVGTYTFRVTNSTGCKSPPTATVEIKNQASTTWNGSAWSNGIPTATKSVVFTGAYTLASDLDACSCTINSSGSLNVPSGRTLNIVNAVTVLSGGSLTFENSSSLMQTNTASNINSGNITYKRNSVDIRQADYVYWSTPVKAQTLGGVSPLTLSDKYLSWENTKWVANPSTSLKKHCLPTIL
ncbi:DUF11 domain-containing protein [Flavobacterium sp. KJJ]|uniref:DUF11 domain-containing protein n=1 Tax=Flavobacterium sp. KJJ TaxID=1270193 RepID=UPI001E38BD75|nr:DUF11 domain-containing protein [Flavobacterium sp. KJJ]